MAYPRSAAVNRISSLVREATRSALPGGGFFLFANSPSYKVFDTGARQRRSGCLIRIGVPNPAPHK